MNPSLTLMPSCTNYPTFLIKNIITNASDESVDIQPQAIPLENHPPSLFALIIGINDYADTENHVKLRGAVPDAMAMQCYLERFLNVPSSQITTLFNSQATRKGILQAFRALADDDRIKKGDPIVIYYAGHGSTEPAPEGWDAESPDIQMIVPQDHGNGVYGIRDRTIGLLINLIADKKGDNITVIFDCCFSGSATRTNELDPTCLVRGCVSKDRSPADLDKDILKDCFRVQSRASDFKGFAHTGLRSHMFLAACGSEERAMEKNGRGLFTGALLETLYRVDAERITYAEMIRRIPDLCGQNPQCEGHNKDRILFNARAPAQGRILYPLRMEQDKEGLKTEYIIDAGAANGVAVGAEFAVYERKVRFDAGSASCSLKVVETNAFSSTLEVISGPSELRITKSTLVLQTREGDEEHLRLYIPQDKNLERVRAVLLNLMQGVGKGQKKISLTDKEKADLDIEYENNNIVFNVLDTRVTAYGVTRIPFGIDLSDNQNLGKIPAIIRGAAHYHWHLRRTTGKHETKDYLQTKVNVEFTKMEQDPEIEFDDHLHRLFRPVGENLIYENVIDVLDNPAERYGIKITNTLDDPLYVSVFYFDNSDFSIQSLYQAPISVRNAKVDPPLQPKGSLTLGYGSGGVPPFRYYLREGQDIDVGFIKLFLSTEQVDLSSILCNSPFESGRTMLENTEETKVPPVWDTILLTLILRRKKREES